MTARLRLFLFLLITITGEQQAESAAAPTQVPVVYSDEPSCKVKSVQKYPSTFENFVASPSTGLVAATQPDAKGIYQVYVAKAGTNNWNCISCVAHPGAPLLGSNKPMISWHPSGQWLVVGVEETTHDNMWMPSAWRRGFLQSGIWLNMWITSPTGDQWHQITDFKKPANGPSDGFVGTSFTPDGKKAVWAEIVDGNVFANHFGMWRLYLADFNVDPNGVPSLVNKKDITPAGARWVEPGNFSPDGRHILLSSDIGISDAQGQDQWTLDVFTAELKNLTHSPAVWDEHGFYSSDGSKISFMSSYPFQNDPSSYLAISLKTEFMLMDADGSHLQQITHFNVAGYPESQPVNTVPAVAAFSSDGSQLFATVMATDYSFTKTNWAITFAGQCGLRSGH